MATKQPIHNITQPLQLQGLIQSGARLIVNFHAPWAAPCVQMNAVFNALHEAQPEDTPLLFAMVPAEALPDLISMYSVSTVPTFLSFASHRLVRRFSGANASQLRADMEWLRVASDEAILSASCDQLVRLGEITLLMKGSPDVPRCGFSRQVVDLLRSQGVVFSYVDMLLDPTMRAAMKVHADWPTFPMLFARGRLIGGLDILRELADSGTLIEELGRDGEDVPDAGERKHEVVKGKSEKTEVGSAAGNGEVVEADKNEQVGEGLQARLDGLTKQAQVMLFMKGSPNAPQCGFSRRMVELLREQDVVFEHFDILQDKSVRAGLKAFSNWPTFPQLYAHGRFVGGLDVAVELVEAGAFRDEVGGSA